MSKIIKFMEDGEHTAPLSQLNNNINNDDVNENESKKLIPNSLYKLSVEDRNKKILELTKLRENLPVYQSKEPILEVISNNLVTIVVGETGSGKTTQIPQFLNDYIRSKKYVNHRKNNINVFNQNLKSSNNNNNKPQDLALSNHKWLSKKIAITQPRRVAAMSIATRVSEEMGCVNVGDKVGYSIRFNDITTKNTQIKFMTDGILLRELLLSPNLDNYSIIIIDEAHERTVRTDILFGLLKQIQQRQLDLVNQGKFLLDDVIKIVIMSATLNADRFSQFFNNAPVLYISGRQFPVKIYSASSRVEDYLDSTIVTIFQIHQLEPKGDILVFLTGQDDIDNATIIINEASKSLAPHHDKLIVCPIYSSLPTQQQQLVFEKTPEGCRKVVLSTNIAETSITIPGIKYVIDTGLSKIRWFDNNKNIEALTIKPISKAAADQRTGRAGRETSGTCYRLYTEDSYLKLSNETEPEILRCNLEGVILLLKSLGINNILNFPYIDRPSRDSLIKSLETLRLLNALNHDGNLTSIGKKMTCFPIEPVFSRILLSSNNNGCTKEILTLISLLSVENIFIIPNNKRDEANLSKQKFKSFDGDHLTLINVFNSYQGKKWANDNFINNRAINQAKDIRKQLSEVAKQQGLNVNLSCLEDRDTASSEPILKSLLTGFFHNIAILKPDNTYNTLFSKQEVHIHPASIMFRRKKLPDVLLFTELIRTTKNYMRCVSIVRPDWVKDIITNSIK